MRLLYSHPLKKYFIFFFLICIVHCAQTTPYLPPSPSTAVAFSPTDNFLAIARKNGEISLYKRYEDQNTFSRPPFYKLNIENPNVFVKSLLFSPDGKKLAAALQGTSWQTVQLWDLENFQQSSKILSRNQKDAFLKSEISSLSFSIDGKKLAISSEVGGEVTIFNLLTEKIEVILKHNPAKKVLAFFLASQAPFTEELFAYEESGDTWYWQYRTDYLSDDPQQIPVQSAENWATKVKSPEEDSYPLEIKQANVFNTGKQLFFSSLSIIENSPYLSLQEISSTKLPWLHSTLLYKTNLEHAGYFSKTFPTIAIGQLNDDLFVLISSLLSEPLPYIGVVHYRNNNSQLLFDSFQRILIDENNLKNSIVNTAISSTGKYVAAINKNGDVQIWLSSDGSLVGLFDF